MDNTQQIVNIQNQIDQEQTRHRNRMQSLKKSLENARQNNNEVYSKVLLKELKMFLDL